MSRSSGPTPKRNTKTNKWYFVFDSIHPRPDGKRQQIKREGFVTLAEAKDALRTALEEDRRSVSGAAVDLTVEAMLTNYLRAKRLAGRSASRLNQIEWASKRIATRWGGWKASALTVEVIEEFYADLLTGGRLQYVATKTEKKVKETGKPLAPATVRQIQVVLKAAFQLAVDRGQLQRNPAALVAVGGSRPDGPIRTWWTPEQIGVFLRYAAKETDLPIGLLEVFVDTGARRGEVAALTWDDFDDADGTLTIRRQMTVDQKSNQVSISPTKRRRDRCVIALHPETVKRLKARRQQQRQERMAMLKDWPSTGVSAGLIFTWPTGEYIHPTVVTRSVGRISRAAGLPRGTCHGFRHSFATAALSAKVPVEVVAARLGDTPRVIQETYAHVLAADDAASARLVGDLFRSATTPDS